MFGKYFQSTFTGSMLGAGADAFAVWGYVVANVDHSRVELNAKHLALVIGMTEARVKMAIAYLEQPDPDSRNPAFEGRRLVKEGGFQYYVPSHEHYRDMRSNADRRDYFREKKREQRKRVKAQTTETAPSASTMSTHVHTSTPMSTQTEAEADTEPKDLPRTSIPTPSANASGGEKPKLSRKDLFPDTRFDEFKKALGMYWHLANPQLRRMPWGKADTGQLGLLLENHPSITLAEFKKLLDNRANSEVNHGDRVYKWLGNVSMFAAGPIDRYGKQPTGGKSNGSNGTQPKTFQQLATERTFAVGEKLIQRLDQIRGDHTLPGAADDLLLDQGTDGAGDVSLRGDLRTVDGRDADQDVLAGHARERSLPEPQPVAVFGGSRNTGPNF